MQSNTKRKTPNQSLGRYDYALTVFDIPKGTSILKMSSKTLTLTPDVMLNLTLMLSRTLLNSKGSSFPSIAAGSKPSPP